MDNLLFTFNVWPKQRERERERERGGGVYTAVLLSQQDVLELRQQSSWYIYMYMYYLLNKSLVALARVR